MAIFNSNIATLQTQIDNLLIQLQIERNDAIYSRWLKIKNQHQFYVGIPNYEKFTDWQQKNRKFKTPHKNLISALTAYEKFLLHKRTSKIHQHILDEIETRLKTIIEIQLLKIQLKQLKKLDKLQNMRKPEIEDIQKRINEKRSSLVEKNTEFAKVLASLPKSKADHTLAIVHKFLKQNTRKIAQKKYIERAKKAGDVAKTANAVRNIITASMMAPSAMTMSMMGVTAANFGMISASTAVAIMGGGIAIAAAGTIAANIVPSVKSRLKIRAARKELANVEKNIERINTLEKTKQAKWININANDAEILLIALEKKILEEKYRLIPTTKATQEIKDYLIEKAKTLATNQLPHAGFVHDNTLGKLTSALGEDPLKILKNGYELQKEELKNRLVTLAKEEKRNRVLFVNGIVALGAITLMAIPTPPTMIAGMVILLATSLVTIGVNRHWDEKIKNVFNKWFKHNSSNQVLETGKGIGPQPEHQIRHSNSNAAIDKGLASTSERSHRTGSGNTEPLTRKTSTREANRSLITAQGLMSNNNHIQSKNTLRRPKVFIGPKRSGPAND